MKGDGGYVYVLGDFTKEKPILLISLFQLIPTELVIELIQR